MNHAIPGTISCPMPTITVGELIALTERHLWDDEGDVSESQEQEFDDMYDRGTSTDDPDAPNI
jgi:hypothetical protein